MRYTFFLRPRKPFACLRTFLWRARAVTPRFTLGMARPSARVRQHAADRRRVGVVHGAAPAHLALPLRALLGQDVALVGAAALDAAAATDAETLRRAPLALHLGHMPSFVFSYDAGRFATRTLSCRGNHLLSGSRLRCRDLLRFFRLLRFRLRLRLRRRRHALL